MRTSEDRLRVLHQYAMARYDQLRAEGASPFEAMRETVTFGRHPDPRPGQPAAARHPLDAVPPAQPGSQPPGPEPPHPEPAPTTGIMAHDRAEARGQQIIAQLQARARAAGRPALGARSWSPCWRR